MTFASAGFGETFMILAAGCGTGLAGEMRFFAFFAEMGRRRDVSRVLQTFFFSGVERDEFLLLALRGLVVRSISWRCRLSGWCIS